MKHRRLLTAPVFIIMVSIVIITILYLLRPTAEIRSEAVPGYPLVKVITATPRSHQMNIQSQGTVMPRRQIDLVAEVSGRVIAVSDSFVSGGFFGVNEPLVTLDDRDYRYALVVAEAQVVERKKALAVERGQARQARRQWRDLGNSEANALFLRKPQLSAANAHLLAAIAQRQQAELNIERTKISAPFAGRVRSTAVDIGQYVSPNTVVATVYDSTLAEVRLPLTDGDIARIGLPVDGATDNDSQADVTLSATIAGERYEWRAQITRTEASIDRGTRFYIAVAEVIEPADTTIHPLPLAMGLFVDARIAGRRIDRVVGIPKKAVLGNNTIFVVDDNHLLQRRSVAIVDKDDHHLWLTGDIQAGEKIVVSDARVLTDGLRVISAGE